MKLSQEERQRLIDLTSAINILHKLIGETCQLNSVSCKLARIQAYVSSQKPQNVNAAYRRQLVNNWPIA